MVIKHSSINFKVNTLSDIFETRIVETDEVTFNNPTVIGGFIGHTSTGFVAVSYIIERLELHQVAHVKSPHIPPVSVFIGKKLRTPFRIYSNQNGTLMVMICEVPISNRGIYEVATALLKWISEKNPRDIVVLEGAPVVRILNEHRVKCVANEEKLKQFTKLGIEASESTLITGMGAAILNECASYKISGVTLMTQAPIDVADPGSVLALIRAVNTSFELNIETEILEKSAKEFHAQLQELINQYKKAYPKEGKPPVESMYG